MPDAGSLVDPASAPVPASAPGELVTRPDPGTLARGAWEAPPWAFYVAATVVVLAALFYAAQRSGLLARLRSRSKPTSR